MNAPLNPSHAIFSPMDVPIVMANPVEHATIQQATKPRNLPVDFSIGLQRAGSATVALLTGHIGMTPAAITVG